VIAPEENAKENGALHLSLDLDSLTLGELEMLEEATERPWVDVTEELQTGKPAAKTVVAIVWIIGRRKDPAFTLERARATSANDLVFDTPPKRKRPHDHLAKRGARRRPPA
jgi:hypothetical protein